MFFTRPLTQWIGRPGRKESPVPDRLLLQWHITERCNLQCAHCYQDAAAGDSELDFSSLVAIVDQFLHLLDDFDRRRGCGRTRGYVTVTGGEPFLREDFLDLLDLLAAHRRRLSFAILTNGTLIDARTARFLRFLQPRFVQVSLEGGPDTHDRIRGHGNFRRVCEAARLLVRHGVRTMISCTAHRDNYREFDQVVDAARLIGVHQVWTDRLIPLGRGEDLRDLLMSPDETREWVDGVLASRRRTNRRFWSRTRVNSHRALQFLGHGGNAYACSAGRSLITLLPNGDLVPCRRMPVPAGNALRDGLVHLYWNSPALSDLRRHDSPPEGCETCAHSDQCRGGLRCLSHAVHGNPFHADPGCWLAGTHSFDHHSKL